MSEATVSPAPLRQSENTKLAVWLFLGGEVVFFTTLIMTYVYLRLKDPQAYLEVKGFLSVPLIAVNTFVLIASSYLVVRALESVQRGNLNGLRNNLIGVFILGATFLSGQAFEWISLFREGIGVANLFGSPFFGITGIHGTHVFVGLVWLVYIFLSLRRKAYSESNHQGVELFGLYWHFVDIVWIVLFTILYLI
jgi:heme/copper-type cytochrome/quinol oxidase subunit 3